MAKTIKIEQRTHDFIDQLNWLEEHGKRFTNAWLKDVLDIRSASTISEIKGLRQNIQPHSWEKFKEVVNKDFSELIKEYEAAKSKSVAQQQPIPFSKDGDSTSATNDWREKYYKQLEENNRLLNNQLNQVQTLTQSVEKRLATIEERQLTIATFQDQVNEALLDHICLMRNLDPAKFRKEVYNRSSSRQDLLSYIKDTADGSS